MTLIVSRRVCLFVVNFDAMSRKLSHLGVRLKQGPIGKCLWCVDWWRKDDVTWLWRQNRDATIFKVVAFGN